jgi:3-deoxy-D-manno-octulosonate 8-phosphate phosphatase (KDO 8-P phosphatase)
MTSKTTNSVMTPTERAADIRLLVLDVDGILTDGRLYFSSQGEDLKCFHVRDGAGIVQLLRAGVQVAIISGRDSPSVTRRMSELGVTYIRQGVNDKLAVLNELLRILNMETHVVACMGDDSADVPILKIARLSISVPDAHASAKEFAHFITQSNGGQGAVREACDLILNSRLSSSRRGVTS